MKSKQNITRDIEIKNKLTVTRGEMGGDNEGKGGRVLRNNYKGHMDKANGSVGSGEGGGDGWGSGTSGEKIQTTVLQQ